jgi:Leucine-rich repeat (LRR) protein
LRSVKIFAMNLECNFTMTDYNYHGDFYTCEASNLNISVEGVKFTSVKGKHLINKTDADVWSLKLSNKNVKFFASGFKEIFPNLKEFHLHSSGLEIIERKSFVDIKFIETLSLYGNIISRVGDYTFYDMTQLKVLSVSYNKLEILPTSMLNGAKQLEELYLQFNNIQVIPKGYFKTNFELKIIWLNNNKLTAIDSADFLNMKNLKVFDLNENQCISKKYEKISKGEIKIISIKCGLKEEKTSKPLARKGKSSQLKINAAMFLFVLILIV